MEKDRAPEGRDDSRTSAGEAPEQTEQGQMKHEYLDDLTAHDLVPTIWSAKARSGAETTLDPETAVTLACHLVPVFEKAASWDELVKGLAVRGFTLRMESGDLALVCTATGLSICTCRSIGQDGPTLAKRLGKPCVSGGCGSVKARAA